MKNSTGGTIASETIFVTVIITLTGMWETEARTRLENAFREARERDEFAVSGHVAFPAVLLLKGEVERGLIEEITGHVNFTHKVIETREATEARDLPFISGFF